MFACRKQNEWVTIQFKFILFSPCHFVSRIFKLPCHVFLIIITDEDPWIGVETSDMDYITCPIVID